MFKIFPKKSMIFKSKLSKGEVISKLSENIDKLKIFAIGPMSLHYKKPFIGKIDGDSFEIMKNINYQKSFLFNYTNSFQPFIKGEVSSRPNGSKIKVDFVIAKPVKIFMQIWLGMLIIMGIFPFFSMFIGGFNLFNLMFLIMILIMSLFGSLITKFGFKFGLKGSVESLKEFFEASVQEDEQNPLYDHE